MPTILRVLTWVAISVLGAGAVAFSGRISRRALPRGTHRITLVATDAAGNRSLPVRLTFRIVR